MFQTLAWDEKNKILKLLDQRLLPHQVVYKKYRRASQVARAINKMVVRGAPAIGITGAFGLTLEALHFSSGGFSSGDGSSSLDFWHTMNNAYQEIVSSRPTAVNLSWALNRLWKNAETAVSPREVAEQWEKESLALLQEDINTNKKIGENGAALLNPGCRILTHCNAGALATAGWGTALGIARTAHQQGKVEMVYAGETRPYLQGARLTAFELLSDGIPVTLFTDNSAGHLMQKGLVDAVIVGADRIAFNGDTANKIGTYSLAILANYHQVPFYAAAPLSTVDPETENGDSITIEERDASEVTHLGGQRIAPGQATACNPSFDVTPARLVSGIITEKGVIKYPGTPGEFIDS